MPIDQQERERRHQLIQEHYAAENDHDLERIMDTFAKDAVMQYNHQSFSDDEQIRWAHGYLGMSAAPGALCGLKTIIDEEHFTAEETVIEGRMCGNHGAVRRRPRRPRLHRRPGAGDRLAPGPGGRRPGSGRLRRRVGPRLHELQAGNTFGGAAVQPGGRRGPRAAPAPGLRAPRPANPGRRAPGRRPGAARAAPGPGAGGRAAGS